MRDLIDAAEPDDAPGVRFLRLPPGATVIAGAGKLVDGDLGASGRVMGVAGENGVRRAPYRPGFPTPFDHALAAIVAVYAAAMRVMVCAGPMSFASSEPWVESDEDYRRRLIAASAGPTKWRVSNGTLSLEYAGMALGLPRARLVPVEG